MQEKAKQRFLLIYGSVTGKAESIADLIFEEALNRGLAPEKHCMKDVGKKFSLEKENLAVLVSSTTGDGDQPENAEPLWRKIKKKALPPDHLKGLRFTILGLGDSNYSQFCNGPKTLHQRLLDLGAETFYDPGWADDGVGLELVVEPWIENFWPVLLKELNSSMADLEASDSHKNSDNHMAHHNLVKTETDLAQKMNETQIEEIIESLNGIKIGSQKKPHDLQSVDCPDAPPNFISISYGDVITTDRDPELKTYPQSDTEMFPLKVKSVKCLTKDPSVKEIYLASFDLKDTTIRTKPGDAVSIICPNSPEEISAIIKRLRIEDVVDREAVFQIKAGTTKKNAKVPDFIPKKSSLREALTWHLDLRSVPKKPLIRTLAEYTSNDEEKSELLYLCSKQGGNDYLAKVRGCGLCLLDLLLTYHSCNPPVEVLFEHLPRLPPRHYSAAGLQDVEDGCVEVVFSLVTIPQGEGRVFPRNGLCTGLFAKYANHNSNQFPKLFVFGRSNKSFRHPSNLSNNIIMIGPGTGVAPFRGFLQERKRMIEESRELNENPGQAWLFFGCRYQDKDFIFRNDVEDFKESNVLSKFLPCFSRDVIEDGVDLKVKYVQDNIYLNKKEFIELLSDKKTIIYVCGDAKNMARDVNDTIIKCYAEVNDVNITDAKKAIASLSLEKRYLQDVWT